MENHFNKKVVKIIVDNVLIDPNNPLLSKGNPRSSGTGFFIDNNGTILTCSHVIENGANITIEIPGLDKILKAKILGICPELDIGLLKVDYKNKEYLKMGNSKNIKLGMDIYIVGYPGTNTSQNNIKINKGIISGTLADNIMIDSPINSGNSGGPLIYKNKVIGINIASLIGKQNMNLSVPIHLFKNLYTQLKNSKNIITYKNTLPLLYNNSNENYYNKSFKKSGVYIYDNLKLIDIPNNCILHKINNYNIDNYGKINNMWFGDKMTIQNYITNLKQNSIVKLEYYNINEKKNHKISYKLKPIILPIRDRFPLFEKIDFINIEGGIFQELNMNIIQSNPIKNFKYIDYYELINRVKSVVIISFIYANSYLGKLGVYKDGTIISKVNDKKIKSFSHFKSIINKNNDNIKLEDENGKIVFIKIKNNKLLLQKLLKF